MNEKEILAQEEGGNMDEGTQMPEQPMDPNAPPKPEGEGEGQEGAPAPEGDQQM